MMLTADNSCFPLGTAPLPPLYVFEEVVRKNTAVELTYDPCHQTQNDCDGDEGPVPDVIAAHRCNAQKDED